MPIRHISIAVELPGVGVNAVGKRKGCPHVTETALSPDTILQLAPNFRTRLDAAGHVIVDSPAGPVIDIGPQGFAILSMFSRPVTLGEAIERLETEYGGSTEFAPTISVVNM